MERTHVRCYLGNVESDLSRTHHIFSVDEFYWEDRPRYYAALDAVRREGED